MLPDRYWIRDLHRLIETAVTHPQRSDTCIIILNFNNKASILKLAGYLRDVDADVLIVDNHSADGSFDALKAKYADRFNLIRTGENLGGAGGFGLGIQWVVDRGYDYCFVSEEDALPVAGDEDIFVEMLKYRAPGRFVVARYYELETNSFNLHYTIYPTRILKMAGTLNMGLFFRADDQEWGMRIRTALRREGERIETLRVERAYTHPLIKSGYGLFANYFSIRNAFLVYLKYPQRNFLVDYGINFVKYAAYGIFTRLFDGNPWPFRQFAAAYRDFLFEDLTRNRERIAQFAPAKLEPATEYRLQRCDFETFHRRFGRYKVITTSMANPHFASYSFGGDARAGVIASKYNGVARIRSFWYRRIVFVEEIDFIARRIAYVEYENRRRFSARVWIAFSVASAAFLALVSLPVPLWKKLRRTS